MLLFVVIIAMFDPCVHMVLLRMFNGDEPVYSYARSFMINFVLVGSGIGFSSWAADSDANGAEVVAVVLPGILAYLMTVRLTLSPFLNAIPVVVLFLIYKGAVLHLCGEMAITSQSTSHIFPTVEAEMPAWMDGEFWYSDE